MKFLNVYNVSYRLVVTKCTSSFPYEHNLQSIISNMPKEIKHTAALKQHRQIAKEKIHRKGCVPGIVTLQVLGSGAPGAPRCLYIFTDQSRYIFNCGEGSQRLSHEHRMRLGKLDHIFFTHCSWENIGGVLGMSLTLQDVGVPEISIHGPPGIGSIFPATRKFIVLKDLAVKTAKCNASECFEDNLMRINYVPLTIDSGVHHKSRRDSVSLDRSKQQEENNEASENESSCTDGEGGCSTTDDEVNCNAFECDGTSKIAPNTNRIRKKRKKKKNRSLSASLGDNNRNCCLKSVNNVAMNYICKLHPRAGALCLESCVERGVPPGPLLGQLKNGKDITLPNGTVVKSSEVTLPDDPGPVFIVVECPDERFLDPFENETKFSYYQAGATDPNDIAYLVVHFTPPHIVQNPRYKNWMEKFPKTTQHLMINEANSCMGSVAVHRIQYKLNMLDTNIFPLLGDKSIPICSEDSEHYHTNQSAECNENGDVKGSIGDKSSVGNQSNSHSSASVDDKFIHMAKTFSSIHLRPDKRFSRSHQLKLVPSEYEKEVMFEPGFLDCLNELKSKLSQQQTPDNASEYPSILFLGTGSCIPNKTRNTSGILINISENCSMIMDCGEGTYGQIVRFYGQNNIPNKMKSLKAIYVSHLHADHQIGLINLIVAKNRYDLKNSVSTSPLYLFVPNQIMAWLSYYHVNFESILDNVVLIPNFDLVFNNYLSNNNYRIKAACEILELQSILTTPVIHCPDSYGVSITHKSGWKITYSGDTKPCNSLVVLGQNSDLLIHEATMEDELQHEAQIKMHSTTSEAIDIGRKMNAKFTILTHFSQRYATLPRFNDNFTEKVGIAFDNMIVRFSDFKKIPLMYPTLKLMFSLHQEDLEQKAYRRQLKQLRMERSRSPSPASKR